MGHKESNYKNAQSMGRHRKSPRLSFWPQHPQVPPLGHDPSNRMKILFNMFSIFYLWEHTQSLV